MSDPTVYEKPSMTLAEILELARLLLPRPASAMVPANARRLAKGILDLLGEGSLCGIDPPTIVDLTDGGKGITICYGVPAFDLGEARAYCAMVLHACDEAEK